eukprot:CAMPEP_0180685120 /NCGR_PEP_ID=MMETSP1037_2-20121125/72152_1 /TAXON_ID=632150 /ORGANISM="Azadinium spinosum, Strain 3D9" /LENGTH=115 /DNA_ID=CAMNT_0022715621 /DNA_START=171 /DNA_END=518 /DNA_ORIENTATION=-
MPGAVRDPHSVALLGEGQAYPRGPVLNGVNQGSVRVVDLFLDESEVALLILHLAQVATLHLQHVPPRVGHQDLACGSLVLSGIHEDLVARANLPRPDKVPLPSQLGTPLVHAGGV